jgi:hypothetical protein
VKVDGKTKKRTPVGQVHAFCGLKYAKTIICDAYPQRLHLPFWQGSPNWNITISEIDSSAAGCSDGLEGEVPEARFEEAVTEQEEAELEEIVLEGNLCSKYMSVLEHEPCASQDKIIAILCYLSSIKHWPNVKSFCVQLAKQDPRYQGLVDQFPRVPFCILSFSAYMCCCIFGSFACWCN